MKNTTRIRLVFAFLLLVLAPGITLGQTKGLQTTTAADPKFGPEGTVETTSDEKLKVVKEVWKDKGGNVRETLHYKDPSKEGTLQADSDIWSFFNVAAPNQPTFWIAYDEKEKYFVFPHPSGFNTVIADIDKSQAEKWIEQVEKQFAEDGTIVEPWKGKKTSVQQPNLKWDELSNQAKEPKPESKPEELKKTELSKEEPKKDETPKKEDLPKTDKTSTGGSGGNTASTTPFTAPGYAAEVKKELDLTRLIFTGPNGGITVNIPADWRPGESFTGSLWLEPAGKDDKDRDKNTRELDKYSFEMDGMKITRPNRLVLGEPNIIHVDMTPTITANLESIGIRVREGDKLVARTQLPLVLQPAPPPTAYFTVLTGGQYGNFVTTYGPFNGETDGSTKIGGELVPTIAESQHSRIVWNTSKSIVPTIEVTENGQTGQCPFHNVLVSMSTTAPIHLLRGQTADVTVTFSGLGQLNQDIPYDVINHSPNVVHMSAGAEAQTLMIPASKIVDPTGPHGGTYTDKISISGWAPGAFVITATVHWKETCNLPLEAMHKQ